MTENWFGEDVAETYDVDESASFHPDVLDPMVDFLASLAGEGPVLEFAIGTGRVALLVSARGLSVQGIELSEAMLARLRAKPGGDAAAIPVLLGDMSTAQVPDAGRFTLVYLVYNTITNLTDQIGQVRCFANAAHHLAPGGHFVIETFVPRLRWLSPGESFVVSEAEVGHLCIDEYDTATQHLTSHHVYDDGGTTRQSSTPFRYVWPSELDLMAQMAGLSLSERWADWRRSTFTSQSQAHVSVWRKGGH